MAVLELVRHPTRETAAVLQALADLAKRGEVVGIALCYLTNDRKEESAFTGAYKANPAEAVNAAMRLSWALTKMQDALTGPP